MRAATITTFFLASVFLAACEQQQGADQLEPGQVQPDDAQGGTSAEGALEDTQGGTSVQAGGVEGGPGDTSVDGDEEE